MKYNYKNIFPLIFLSLVFLINAQDVNKLKRKTAVMDVLVTSVEPAKLNLKVSKSLFPIAIVGELRSTTFWQSLFVWEPFVNGGDIKIGPEENDEERLRIINQITSDSPAMVMALGNLVHYGSKGHHWEYYDNLIRPLQLKKIPIYAALGEHDYWGRNGLAMKYIANRFPIFRQKTWYSKVSDSIGIIVLDSNQDELRGNSWKKQKLWFDKTLDEFDNNDDIKGVIVFVHHSPFSNTKQGDSEHVKSTFLPPFISSVKTMAMISGNAATYERFDKYGKAFIVTGGGGAPRSELIWNNTSHKDEFRRFIPDEENKFRPFNFVTIDTDPAGLKFTVKGLKKGNRRFFIMEEFTLKFNANN